MKFTKREVAAIRHMVADLAKRCREDVVGAILYTGACQFFDEDDREIVALANKLEVRKPRRKKLK